MLSPEVREASLRALVECRTDHQPVGALVHIAEPLFEPHHRLAVGGEAEMPWLDDAGMDRADRDLVQILSFHGQELVRIGFDRALPRLAERLGHAPEAEIEPVPRIRRAGGFEAVKVGDGALEPDRRRMMRADRGELAVGAFQGEHGDGVRALLEQGKMHRVLVAPQPEQRRARLDQCLDRAPPAVAADNGARPRAVVCRFAAGPGDVGEWCHCLAYPSSFATAWNQATSAAGR